MSLFKYKSKIFSTLPAEKFFLLRAYSICKILKYDMFNYDLIKERKRTGIEFVDIYSIVYYIYSYIY